MSNRLSARLVVYVREGCHLCDEMAQQLQQRLPAEVFSLIDWRDVDSRQSWFEKYDRRVPLVLIDDHPVAEYFLEESAISSILNSQRPDD